MSITSKVIWRIPTETLTLITQMLKKTIHRGPKMSTFLFCCSFYKNWPISIKFGTRYTEFATQQLLICPLHLHSVTTLLWEKLIRGFRTILADLLCQNAVKSTSKLEDKIWPIKDFCYCVLSRCCADARHAVTHLCHCCDTDILQQDCVPAHRARRDQLSYCNVKLPSSLVQWSRLYDLQLALILVLLNTEYRV